jgi:glycosyltransferase involved in cell wall biosynthesis
MVPGTGFPSLGSPQAISSLFQEVGRADIVHVSFSREFLPVLTVALAKLRGKPTVLQPHGMLTARTSRLHRVLDLVIRPLFRGAKAVIALTRHEKAALLAWSGNDMPECFVVGNPRVNVLPSSPLGSAVKDDEALFLARLEPRKHVTDFAEAALIAHNAGWGDQYKIVGPDQGDLQKIQAVIDSCPNLSYEGPIPGLAVAARLQQCRVFVLPSFEEPWGNVLVLALSLGIPVVVARSAALATDVETFGAGEVVDDGDAVGLARAVHRLLTEQSAYLSARRGALLMSETMFDQQAIKSGLQSAYAYGQRV